MAEILVVSDVARRLGVRPAQVSQILYERRLRDDLCPVVGGRRLIPPEYLDIIAQELRRKGITLTRRSQVAQAPERTNQ